MYILKIIDKMKKQDKELLIKIFEQYILDNNLYLKYGTGYRCSDKLSLIKKPTASPTEMTTYTRDMYLFENKLSDIDYLSTTYSFMSFLLENSQTRDIGYRFMIEKCPLKMNESEYKYEENYLAILEPFHDLLLKYITRPSHLLCFFPNIEPYFEKNLIIQEERELMIDVLLSMALFKTLDNERVVYNFVQNYIENKEKYYEAFPNIKVSSDQDKDLEMIMKDEEMISFTIKTNVLINYNSGISLREGNTIIKRMMQNISPLYGKLEVNSLLVRDLKSSNDDSDIKTFEICWRGNNLNKNMLTRFTNFYLKEQTNFIVNSINKWSSMELEDINVLIIKSRALSLEESLSHKIELNTVKRAKL